ncbi:nose resistant to fluoxetine protein 6-like [Ylistrum balloti]|uniref:nose resistant to fluoxetine protein 6-like n=1 Tax=Ylistrum balloti TaxID=509963 RepID=UPI002905B235|nr:nose resistant to fluoxetine protein 6-like [Ylistrum balloti]
MRKLLVVSVFLALVCVPDINGDVTTTAKPKQQNQNYLSLFEKGIETLLNSNISTSQGFSQLSNLVSLFPTPTVQDVLKLLKDLNVSIPSASQATGASQLTKNLQAVGQSLASSYNVSQGYYKYLSPACNVAMGTFGSQLLAGKQWALNMLDSWGKPHSGITQGNIKWYGMYDECMDIVAEVNGDIAFETNYCGAYIHTPITGPTGDVELIMRVCLPSVCTGGDPSLIANAFLAYIPVTPKLTVDYAWCQTEPEYDLRTTITICVCGAFLALMTLATLFDVFVVGPARKKTSKISNDQAKCETTSYPNHETGEDKNIEAVKVDITNTPSVIQTMNYKPTVTPRYTGVLSKMLLSFSVWTNGRKLLSAEQTGGTMGAINGIRFLSMSWVILGHTYIFSLMQGSLLNAFPFGAKMIKRRSFMAITNGLLSVDTFFTMSGLLLSYVFMKEMKRERGRINWFMFYFHRFWRLTPPYMLVMMLDIVVFRYLGDGPEWSPTGLETDYCKESWWTNLLYVNNFVKTDKTCFGWSWYLANDMQFYVASPLILVPLYFSKKIGSVIVAIFLLGTTIVSGIVSKHFELPSTQYSTVHNPHSDDYFNNYYIKPYCRMGPYLVGLITGYILYRTKGKYKIAPPVNIAIWIVMTIIGCLVTYGIYEEANGNWMSVDVAALYNAVHKPLWGVCVSWVIFACVTGNGGFINTILSWSPFIPLGRLSYCAYLVHPIVIFVYMRSLKQTVYATDFVMIYLFLGHLVTSYAVAFVVSLAFESPMMGLEKAIFRRGEKKK